MIPGQYVLGALINGQCLFWSTNECRHESDDRCVRFKDPQFSWAVFGFGESYFNINRPLSWCLL
jgi:hypothetical protein